MWLTGLVAPHHVESSQTGDQTCVPLHWQEDSQPLDHHGSPQAFFFTFLLLFILLELNFQLPGSCRLKILNCWQRGFHWSREASLKKQVGQGYPVKAGSGYPVETKSKREGAGIFQAEGHPISIRFT